MLARWSAGWALALPLLLIMAAVLQLQQDLASSGQRCQTTYIRQSYNRVDLGPAVTAAFPGYSLIEYTGDGLAQPPGERAAPRQSSRGLDLKNQLKHGRSSALVPPAGGGLPTVPVLFVHGHLGTHQQVGAQPSMLCPGPLVC